MASEARRGPPALPQAFERRGASARRLNREGGETAHSVNAQPGPRARGRGAAHAESIATPISAAASSRGERVL